MLTIMKKFSLPYILSEYTVYFAALVTLVFIFNFPTFTEGLAMFVALFFLVVSAWCFGFMLKYFFKKERPSKELRIIKERDRYAFPSMHTLTLASVAAAVTTQNILFGLVLFMFTCFVMYGRTATYMHDYADVFFGLFFGVIISLLIFPFCLGFSFYIFGYAQLM